MGQICSKADDGGQLIMDANDLPQKNKKKKQKDGVIHNNTKYGNQTEF